MKVNLGSIASARSGDKGKNTNIGLVFNNKKNYIWAKENITSNLIKKFFKEIVNGNVLRYELDNLLSLNFILEDSLGGGGSDSLFNDAQGKSYGQAILLMEINLPDKLQGHINE